MAEIKIEKKKPLWPWVLGVGIIALLLYFLVFNRNEDSRDDSRKENEKPVTEDLINVQENNTTVTEYITFIQSDSNTMDASHEFASQALLKLADATKAIAGVAGYDIKGDVDTAKAYANQITRDPSATSHANTIKNAADILAGVLNNIQQAKYPSLGNEAAELRNSANAISADVLTLDQRDAVKTFFNKAAQLLQKMN